MTNVDGALSKYKQILKKFSVAFYVPCDFDTLSLVLPVTSFPRFWCSLCGITLCGILLLCNCWTLTTLIDF